MAGRGRGAGKSLSFDVQQLGFGRGESLPPPIQQPPPLFQILDNKPQPLLNDQKYADTITLKRNLKTRIRDSIYYITNDQKASEIERYSDKYRNVGRPVEDREKLTSWAFIPNELKDKVALKRKLLVQPNVANKRPRIVKDLESRLKNLEGKETKEEDDEDTTAKEKAKNQDDDDEDVEPADVEVYDEEEQEEGTDYANAYFDPGDNYVDDEEDNLDDGATY